MLGIDNLDHAGKAKFSDLNFRRHDMPRLENRLIADRIGALQFLTLFVGNEHAALVKVKKISRHPR